LQAGIRKEGNKDALVLQRCLPPSATLAYRHTGEKEVRVGRRYGESKFREGGRYALTLKPDVAMVLLVGVAMRKDAHAHGMSDHIHVENILDVAKPPNQLGMAETEADANASGGITLGKRAKDQKIRMALNEA